MVRGKGVGEFAGLELLVYACNKHTIPNLPEKTFNALEGESPLQAIFCIHQATHLYRIIFSPPKLVLNLHTASQCHSHNNVTIWSVYPWKKNESKVCFPMYQNHKYSSKQHFQLFEM